MHIGILTGGGDCPGLNAVIRAVTLALIKQCGAHVTGIRRGFLGLLDRQLLPLDEAVVGGILAQGGTILGTHNRCDPFHYFAEGGADVSARLIAYVQELGLDALVVIGGDGSMAIADKLSRLGLPIVGVPKTIDNDLCLTDRSFGFDSAVSIVAEALDRLETTARSHGRVMIAETMGRYAGWIALEGGIAGAADVILIPELPYSVAAVAEVCRRREQEGAGHTLICIAEGAHPRNESMVVSQTLVDSPDPLRLGGVGAALAHQLQSRLNSEVRSTMLGHVQRGGSPTAFDRILATQFGWAAAQLIKDARFGRMVVLQGSEMRDVALAEVAGRNRLVPLNHPLLLTAQGLGLCLGQ
ncbi:6-phosphofructokinase [Roseateles oligotrophus]|uniref:ATP-dependent 6-phosphofructokinase n=1 Tax=Roseateles oligotrophus TaxID=1769250 RepID=A0ABT2YMH0_9BURK|nr:ATP-dependent 6-phosphofructokinase [Roseateles oligotrophus]MCV2371258.1 ATP-dependent 6-phosphofructokinase [Roseateles oligotrophus]